MFDDRFTSDLLADILFIQQSKTLLRRHLSIQFSQLIGKDLNQKKRDVQCSPKYRPLTISSKIKVNQMCYKTMWYYTIGSRIYIPI